jgi:hypothetical protein
MGVTSILANDGPDVRRGALFTSAQPSPRIYKMLDVQGYDPAGLAPPPRTIGDLMTRGRKMDAAELNKRVDDLASRATVDVANVKRIDRVMLAGALIDRAALLRAGR